MVIKHLLLLIMVRRLSCRPDVAQGPGLPLPHKTLVIAIDPNSPAEKAKLKIGDVWLSVRGDAIATPIVWATICS